MKSLVLVVLVVLIVIPCAHSLSCLKCDPKLVRCRTIPELKCKGGLTANACGCCAVCAKIKGEKCGGPFDINGKCDCGLICRKNRREVAQIGKFNASGRCVRRFFLKLYFLSIEIFVAFFLLYCVVHSRFRSVRLSNNFFLSSDLYVLFYISKLS